MRSKCSLVNVFPLELQHLFLGKLLQGQGPFNKIPSFRPKLSIASIATSEEMESEEHNGYKSSLDVLTSKPYTPPSWASHLTPIPSHRFSLAHAPTPIHRWKLPNLPKGTEVWLKRDDSSVLQLSGNKVRKLEFIMADAVANGADCIITIGGIQSNHCHATAGAATYLNLDCYLILSTSKVVVDQDPGLTGNLLVERLIGADIQLVSEEEFEQIGHVALTNILKERLVKEGRKPYVIPAGGSNPIGTWGYIEAIREIEQQVQASSPALKFDDIVVACSSGGTAAGLALGSWLGNLKAKVHAFSVYDLDYLHSFVQCLTDGLTANVNSHDIINLQNAKGLGYARSTSDELQFVKEVAISTGVVLDPVYSGKAAYGMMKDMAENPKKWEGRKVLFIHTGGILGLYDKVDQLSPLVGSWSRMHVDESVPRNHGTEKML